MPWIPGEADHPRLLDPVTGLVVAERPGGAVPVKSTCVGHRRVPTPVAALHPDGSRPAVAQADRIALISLP
ncbi:hypothetical protein ACFXDH_37380 [Streptomyces sp. NPDC059467]|uniref:hypothetical protein n=1 Tax=Streptomyces sp. NPDC059467 TaxID=3346844 RepID=UPI0036D0A6DF